MIKAYYRINETGIAGYRPALIDEELYRLLDDFRGFRHTFRHAYAFELDWEKERLVAEKFSPAVTLFRKQVVSLRSRHSLVTKVNGYND